MKMMVNRSNEKCKLKNWTLIYISNELSKYKEGANSDQVFLRENTSWKNKVCFTNGEGGYF